MPRYWEVLDIATATIDALREIGVEECCFIGGMACKLYTRGEGRMPKDLDILCLTPYPGGAEAIKQGLCDANDNFYTVEARNPRDQYDVLWWDTGSDEPGFERFKVDILVPGVMGLPWIHADYIINIDKLPCAPLHLLLLHKLQGWADRRRSPRPDQRAKIPADVRDIGDMLRIANRLRMNITKGRPYITDSFSRASYMRVREFSAAHPNYVSLWMGLGLQDPTEGR